MHLLYKPSIFSRSHCTPILLHSVFQQTDHLRLIHHLPQFLQLRNYHFDLRVRKVEVHQHVQATKFNLNALRVQLGLPGVLARLLSAELGLLDELGDMQDNLVDISERWNRVRGVHTSAISRRRRLSGEGGFMVAIAERRLLTISAVS